MKPLLLIFAILTMNYSKAQSKDFINVIDKTIGLNLNTIPQESLYDSLYYLSTLLKIQVDGKGKITSISFSDNAEPWLVNQLDKAKSRMDLNKIEAQLKKEKIKNTDIVFPFIIRSMTSAFEKVHVDLSDKNKYFSFNKIPLSGLIKFCAVLEYPFYNKK